MNKIYKRVAAAVIALTVTLTASVFGVPESIIAAAENEPSAAEETTPTEEEPAAESPNCDGTHEGMTEWNGKVSLQTGKYYLADDIDSGIRDITIGEGVDVTLCLNGHTFTPTGARTQGIRVFNINGGSLTLCDCTESGSGMIKPNNNDSAYPDTVVRIENGKFTMNGGIIGGAKPYNDGYGVSMTGGEFIMNSGKISGLKCYGVNMTGGTFTMNNGEISNLTKSGVYMSGGEFIMEDGTISDNTISQYGENGGGVQMSGGTFTMNGGKIENNDVTGVSSSGSGGGVYMKGSSSSPAVFTMNDGKIENNEVTNGGYSIGSGGGVYVSGYSTFTIKGGAINNNTANAYGGGVFVSSGGEFIMEDGTISNNSSNQNGGGIYADQSSTKTLTVKKSTISNNNALNGGGVFVDGCKELTMEDVTISDNTASTEGGGVCVARCNELIMKNVIISGNTAAKNGGGARLGSTEVTMEDVTISDNTAGKDGGGVYMGSGTARGNVKISGNHAEGTLSENGGGGVFLASTSKFIMESGEISGNGAERGGGVCLYSKNTTPSNRPQFEMTDGTISNNTAAQDGGGVYSLSGELTMNGGEIKNNTAKGNGGGVFLTISTFSSSSSIPSQFIMNAGAIINGNKAENGGGVYLEWSNFTMSGGTISRNSANKNGGGVYIYPTSFGENFTVNGEVEISNNGRNGNIYLYYSDSYKNPIIVVGAGFSTDNKIKICVPDNMIPSGCTMSLDLAKFADGVNIENITQCFVPENMTSSVSVVYNENKEFFQLKGNHDRSDSWNVVKDTEAENGFTATNTCKKCNENAEVKLPAIDTGNGWILRSSHTITKDGTYRYVSDDYGNIDITVPKFSDSTWTKSTDSTEPTATENGSYIYTSNDYGEITVTVPKLSDKVWTKKVNKPTLTEDGSYIYTSTDYGTVEIEIPSLNSKDDDGNPIWTMDENKSTDPTLTEEGKQVYTSEDYDDVTIEIPAFGDKDEDGENIWTKNEDESSDPTMTEPGTYVYESDEYGRIEIDVPALGETDDKGENVWTKNEEESKAPTMTEPGTTVYENDEYGKIEVEIPELSKTDESGENIWTKTEEVAPTKGDPGKLVYTSTNDEYDDVTIEIPSLDDINNGTGGDWTVEFTAPTPDYEGSYVLKNDDYGDITVVLPALNATDENGDRVWAKNEEESKDPGLNEPGEYVYESDVYGGITVPVPELSSDIWTLDEENSEEPTPDQEGKNVYTSGYGTVEVPVPALGHVCGDNAQWTYDEDTKTLTITGDGDMDNWTDENPAPWADVADEIEKVVIDDGITSIGDSAFEGCDKLTDVDIPDSVTSIGDSAFEGCTGLTDVTIPENVNNIGDSAFKGCDNLENVTFDGITPPTMGDGIFEDCSGLENVYVPEESVDDYKAADGLSDLADITVPANGHKHTLTHVDEVPATETTEGIKEHWHCEDCGKDFADENGETEMTETDLTIPATGHKHTFTYVPEVPATETTEGTKEHWHCEDCGKDFADENGETEMTETDLTIPVIGHEHNLTHVDEVPATETTEGTKEHWHCEGCDKYFADENGETEMTETDLTIPATGHKHTLTYVPEVPATETTEGTKEHWHCEDCGKDYADENGETEMTEIDLIIPVIGHEHTLTYVPEEPATETEPGTKEHWHCEDCDKDFADENGETEVTAPDLIIPATGHKHNLTHVDEVPATETTEGTKEHWHCEDCGKDFADENGETEMTETDLTIPIIGHEHTLTYVPEEPATETEPGTKEHWHCEDCDKDFADENGETEMTETDLTIPATGHKHNLTRVDEVPATETTEGTMEHWHCEDCGKDFADENGETEMTETDLIIPVIGHEHTLTYVPEVPATETTEGTKEHWHCEDCGKDFADENGETEITADELKIGKIEKEVQSSENAPTATLTASREELIKAVLTSEELNFVKAGKNIKIILKIDVQDNANPKDKTAVENALADLKKYKLGQYLDVNLFKIIDGEQKEVTETSEPLMITFDIPVRLRGSGRTYSVIRVHNGETTILPDLDNNENTVTIKTDRFSTYALVYSERSNVTPPDNSGSDSSDSTSSESKPTNSGSASSESSGASDNGNTSPSTSSGDNSVSNSDGSTESSDENNSAPSESAPADNNNNPSTGVAVSLIPLAAAITVLMVTVKRKKK